MKYSIKTIGILESSSLKNKKEKAITLIALVITIIVLLILAGVTVATLTGENGLLSKAATARQRTTEAEDDEKDKLSSYENEIDNFINGNRNDNLNNKTFIESEKLEILGTNVGKDINIPAGYKYVIISNSEWTSGGVNHLSNIKIVNNTNSNIILEQSSSDYSGNYGGCSWLVVAEILNTSQAATFSSNNSPAYNIVFGIKE